MSDNSNTQEEDDIQNDHLVLISGASATGKSACLMGLKDPEGVMYLNCESKKLPFKSKFDEYQITDPLEIIQGFAAAEEMPHIHTIVVDTLTFLMDMFESTYVINSANTMKAWGDYAQFLRNLMLQTVAKSTKNVIFLAHTRQIMNESEMVLETKVPVKGSLANAGVEAFFSTVISTKKVSMKQLKATNPLLEITPEEEALGFKYVFQTRLTKETVNERIRSPMKMWSIDETFIDNNLQYVIDRLHEYYD
jgi:hypothetical protein